MKGKSLRKLVDTDGKRYQFNSMAFRAELHEYAKEKQMSVNNLMEDIAEEIGVSISAIKQWQTPKLSGPSDMQKVRDLADYLEQDYQEFLFECKEEIKKMDGLNVKTYDVVGAQQHMVYFQNGGSDVCRVFSEREAANDILRSVVCMFYYIRTSMTDFWTDQVLLEFQADIYKNIQSHMLELPEGIYKKLEEYKDTELECFFGGDSGIDTVFESYIKEQYLEEKYGTKDRELDSFEIGLEFIPYLEKRLLGGLREIFKEYIPK